MSVKIRLQRHGKKGKPFYHIVIADARTKRDGKIIERIGSYNPNTNPATIDLHFEKSLSWLKNGAVPTDTVKSLLSKSGVLMKKHLDAGVNKGAFTEEEAQKRFDSWFEEKQKKQQAELDKISKDKESAKADRIAAEKKYREEKVAKQNDIEKADIENTPEAEAAIEDAVEKDEVKDVAKEEEPTS